MSQTTQETNLDNEEEEASESVKEDPPENPIMSKVHPSQDKSAVPKRGVLAPKASMEELTDDTDSYAKDSDLDTPKLPRNKNGEGNKDSEKDVPDGAAPVPDGAAPVPDGAAPTEPDKPPSGVNGENHKPTPAPEPKNPDTQPNHTIDLDTTDPPTMTGTDEPDRASMYSLYMEKDFRYYFQHPYVRLFIAYFVTFCNFLIYAEDPIAHSVSECFIPVVGNCFAFVCSQYPPNAWSLLKVLLWLAAILVGMLVGKLIVHKLVFNRLFKLKMFLNDQGSWMTMFFTAIMSLFIFSWIFNLFLLAGGESTEPYRITDFMGVKNTFFTKAAACGTWCGDFFTAWMVTDIMLQERLYPHWGVPIKRWWNRGYNRIILFWIVVVATSTIVISVITTDVISWDRLNYDFLPTNEVSRAFLASFILVMDLLIVMQDWDFPHFINNFDIKLPGLNTAHIQFEIPKIFRREEWVVHITGKWFNYGILFVVMLLDLNMWKNAIFYEPYDFRQYVGPEGKVYSALDKESVENHNQSILTYEWRSTNVNPLTNRNYTDDDYVMNSRYYEYALGIKCTAFIPSMSAFIFFFVFIWYFGRWKPTDDDPTAGRLKKRKKRFSLRNFGESIRNSFRSMRTASRQRPRDLGPSVTNQSQDYTQLQGATYPENWRPQP